MKRLLPLAPLPLLLLITMGVGPCDSKPLGSVDGCTYNGKTYGTGVTFKAIDGCNTCSCQNGVAACTLVACADAGSDAISDGPGGNCFDALGNVVACPKPDGGTIVDAGGTDGGARDGAATCFDSNGKTIPCTTDAGTSCTYAGKVYMVGASFPCMDGCNTCTCTANGVSGTTKGCPDASATCYDANGKIIPCGVDGGTIQCMYDGKPYPAGASFPSSDGCNTCSCTTDGMIACTLKACIDSGMPTDASTDGITCFNANGTVIACADAGSSGVCKPGADQTCNDDVSVSSIVGKCRSDGTCDCGAHAINPMTGRCLTGTATSDCTYNGVTYPVGSKFMCSTAPACDTNLCYCATPGTVVAMCSEGQPLPVCGFDAVYTYGQTGGLVAYSDQVTLTPPASYVLTRTVNSSASSAAGGSCGPALPACGGSAIDVDDIMQAIADPTVQLLISLSTMQPTLVGLDQRPVDGTVFSFKKSGTAGFLVGAPCNGAANCTEIPGAVTNLRDYLLKLDAQQRQDPSCVSFLGKM